MERSKVYEIIDGERAYQDAMTAASERPDMVGLNAGNYLLAMEHCLALARQEWYSGHDPHSGSMEYVRKIAGLAVAAMEQYGAPERK